MTDKFIPDEEDPSKYLITAARLANEDGTAVAINTSDFGWVLVSEVDRPALWAKWKNSKVATEPFPLEAKVSDPGNPTVIDAGDN